MILTNIARYNNPSISLQSFILSDRFLLAAGYSIESPENDGRAEEQREEQENNDTEVIENDDSGGEDANTEHAEGEATEEGKGKAKEAVEEDDDDYTREGEESEDQAEEDDEENNDADDEMEEDHGEADQMVDQQAGGEHGLENENKSIRIVLLDKFRNIWLPPLTLHCNGQLVQLEEFIDSHTFRLITWRFEDPDVRPRNVILEVLACSIARDLDDVVVENIEHLTTLQHAICTPEHVQVHYNDDGAPCLVTASCANYHANISVYEVKGSHAVWNRVLMEAVGHTVYANNELYFTAPDQHSTDLWLHCYRPGNEYYARIAFPPERCSENVPTEEAQSFLSKLPVVCIYPLYSLDRQHPCKFLASLKSRLAPSSLKIVQSGDHVLVYNVARRTRATCLFSSRMPKLSEFALSVVHRHLTKKSKRELRRAPLLNYGQFVNILLQND